MLQQRSGGSDEQDAKTQIVIISDRTYCAVVVREMMSCRGFIQSQNGCPAAHRTSSRAISLLLSYACARVTQLPMSHIFHLPSLPCNTFSTC
jgi:hypothetical protein